MQFVFFKLGFSFTFELSRLILYKWNRDRGAFLQEHFYKNNEAQICSKIKNKLRTIEARLQMQI